MNHLDLVGALVSINQALEWLKKHNAPIVILENLDKILCQIIDEIADEIELGEDEDDELPSDGK
jgi:hypothetical protein